MAGELKLRSGTRLQIAFDVPIGQEPTFDLVSTFNKSLDESAFLISVPMRSGKALELDDSQKLLIRCTQNGENTIFSGYADDLVKDGIRRYWKIRRVSEQRQFFQRADERLNVALPITFLQQTWELNDKGEIDKEDGMTMDVSSGGAAININRRMEVGDVCELFLPRVGTSPEGRAIGEIVSAVCWLRETPKGSLYRFACGLQFRFTDGADRDRLRAYTQNLKQKYKL